LRPFRHRLPRQTLPREQGQCLVDRHLVFPRHAVEALLLTFFREFRAQIAMHTQHVLGAHDLDPHLLQRIVGVFGLAPRRHAGGMNAVVVVTQPQCDRVGLAAQTRHLGLGQRAGRQRQPRAFAGHAGRAGLEGDLHIRLLGYGAQHAGGRALELLGARVVFVRRPAH
jgi:hypothetical protein